MGRFRRLGPLASEALGRARESDQGEPRVTSLEERRERGFTASEYRILPAPQKGYGCHMAISIHGTIDVHYRTSREALEGDLADAGYSLAPYDRDTWQRRLSDAGSGAGAAGRAA